MGISTSVVLTLRLRQRGSPPIFSAASRARSRSDRFDGRLVCPGAVAQPPSSARSTTASGRRTGYCLQTPWELPSVKPNSGSTAIMLFWPSVKTQRIVPLAAATAVGVEMAKLDWRTRASVTAA